MVIIVKINCNLKVRKVKNRVKEKGLVIYYKDNYHDNKFKTIYFSESEIKKFNEVLNL